MIVAWNGLAIRAFAEAATAFDRPDYAAVAAEAADFIRTHLWDGTTLRHVWEEGEARFPGFLDDYADLVNGLVSLYETTFDPSWIDWARSLAEGILERFLDPETGDFYDTPADGEQLIVRPKTFVDQGTPSGNGAAAEALLRLGTVLGEQRYLDRATHILKRYAQIAVEHPIACGQLLVAMDFALGQPYEIAIVGAPEDARTRALLRVVFGNYLPNRVVALRRPDDEIAPGIIPLLADRATLDGQPTAYVCRQFVCRQPVTSPAELAAQLGVAVPDS